MYSLFSVIRTVDFQFNLDTVFFRMIYYWDSYFEGIPMLFMLRCICPIIRLQFFEYFSCKVRNFPQIPQDKSLCETPWILTVTCDQLCEAIDNREHSKYLNMEHDDGEV